MKRVLMLFIFLFFTSSMAGLDALFAASSCTVTVAASPSGAAAGTVVTLTPTLSAGCQQVTQVSYFYNSGTTLIGSSNASPFTYSWNTSSYKVQSYDITAVAYYGASGNPTGVQIDAFGDSAVAGALDQSSFASTNTGSNWIAGDNQLCLTSWPYNGASSSTTDGICQWNSSGGTTSVSNPTEDALDDTVHTLSEFVIFSNNFLKKNVVTLSSSVSSWFDQADQWANPSTGRLQPLVSRLSGWNSLMSNWLKNSYASNNTWCTPQSTTGSTTEDNYINSNSSGTGIWGDLPHIIACLNYNATTAVSNYSACWNALNASTCPTSLPNECQASTLGRSLAGAPPVSGYDGCTGTYANWVNNSLTLARNEAPKFKLRSSFLTSIYNRANTLSTISQEGSTILSTFLNTAGKQLETLKPCGDESTCVSNKCADGSSCVSPPTSTLPNAVIYGWTDDPPSGGSGGCTDLKGRRVGCSHLVKVTAYAAGRSGNTGVTQQMSFAQSSLPWVKTSTSGDWLVSTRYYTLTQRDGYVYVSVKRWDEDHSAVLFPNTHQLWQFVFHNTNGQTTKGAGLLGACAGLAVADASGGPSIPVGYGLEQQTVVALGSGGLGYVPHDKTALGNAFMLNDEGDGVIDKYANSTGYNTCLQNANTLLNSGLESHACVEYIAASPASNKASVKNGISQNGDMDYSLKFVDCSTVKNGAFPPDDLTGS